MNNIIEDLRISPLKETNYIKPLKVNFTLNGIKKSWEAVRSHDSVAVLLYHKEKESFLFVKQFRVPVYLNDKNTKGIMQKLDKLHLQAIDLSDFQTHIYLREDHPLTNKEEIEPADLVGLPTVRFTQEKEAYLYYSENLIDTSDSSVVFDVTDRATLNGILERTDAYATGSGYLDDESVNGITVIPFKGKVDNRMVYVKRASDELSQCAQDFVETLQSYFDKKKEEHA